VDNGGNAYVTGRTRSSAFPATLGAWDGSLEGYSDAFIAKLNPAGSRLVYATYLGGDGVDGGSSIAVDNGAYVTGRTSSSNFPVTPGAWDGSYGGGDLYGDAFVAKLNPTGSGLVYATYLGGSGVDWGSGIAVDSGGNAYVIGPTLSSDFPATPGAWDGSLEGYSDAFVAQINLAGSGLVYATYLGGSGGDNGLGIAVDSGGNAYVTGETTSPDFPAIPGAGDGSYGGGGRDAFIAKLNPAGSGLVYATYLGGDGDDQGSGIAVDSGGNVHVTGWTDSSDFPATPGAWDRSYGGGVCIGYKPCADAFIAKLNPARSGPVYATYLGGSSNDKGSGIAVDSSGNAYVTGETLSSDFPATPGAWDGRVNGGYVDQNRDAFVAKIGDNAFLWPVAPTNLSTGHNGPCDDWSDKPKGCYWLSNKSENAGRVWRDVQPFQRHEYKTNKKYYGYHLGADYNLGAGDSGDLYKPIYPTASGTVSKVLENVCGWGNIVFVRHNTSLGVYTSMYAHVNWLDTGKPEKGDEVSPKKRIAKIGKGSWDRRDCPNGKNKGSYPAHLHFELRKGEDTTPGPAYTQKKLKNGEKGQGPQGQINPNNFITTH
jgi:murein DD-endopeptidase MepM/ murein hydrolase activator NlpD